MCGDHLVPVGGKEILAQDLVLCEIRYCSGLN